MSYSAGTVEVEITVDKGQFDEGIQSAQQGVEKLNSSDLSALGSKLSGIGKSMSSIGKSLTAGVTLPVVAGFGLAVKAAADFDTSLSKIRSVTGMTSDEIAGMGDAAREMSKDSTFSATQVADAMYWLADSTSTAEDIQGYLAGAMDLAGASGQDLSETAQVLQGLMKAYNIDASESGKVTDILTVAFQNSLWTGEEFNTAMSYAAATASQMSIPLEDTAAALDVMSRAGYEASTAGAGLRQGLVSLVNPTKDALKALGKYGLTADDVNPQVVGLEKALQNLHDANIDAGDAAKLFGTESMGQMLAVIQASDGDFQTLIGNMKDSGGAAQTAADVMANSAEGKFKIFKDKLLDIGISVGEKLIPPLTRLLDNVIMPLFDAFENMPSGVQDFVLALAGIAATAGPALMALGPLVSGAGSIMGALGGGGGLAGLLGGGGAAAGAAGAAGGIGMGAAAAVAAPVAAVAAFGAWAAVRDFDVDAMADDVGKVGSFLGGIGDQIGSAIGSIDWDGLAGKLSAFGPKLVEKLGEWFGSIDWQQAFTNAVDASSKVINGVIDWFENIDFIQVFSDAGKAAANLLNGVIDWISNINWDQVGADIAYAIGSIDWIGIGLTILDGIAGLIVGIGQFLLNVDWLKVLGGLVNLLTILPRILIGALNSIDWGQLGNDILNALYGVFTWIGQQIMGFFSGLLGGAVNLVSAAATWVANFILGIAGGALQLVVSAATWVSNFVTGIAGGVGQLINGAVQWVSNFITGIMQGPSQLVAGAMQWISDFINTIGQGPGQLISQATQWIGNFIQSLANGPSQLISQATQWVGNFLNGIMPGAGDLVIKAGEWVSNFIDGIAKGVSDLVTKAGDWVSNFISGLVDSGGQIAGKAANLVQQFISGLSGGVIPSSGRVVPWFAHGGYVDKPTLGVFGEAGPEWLIPDDIMQGILNVRSNIIGSANAGSLSSLAVPRGIGDLIGMTATPGDASRSTNIERLILQMGTPSSPRAFARDLARELKLMGLG